MPKRGLSSAWMLFLLGMTSPAWAQAPLCSLDHVLRSGSDVELHFVPGSNVFVRVMKTGQGVSPADRMFKQVGGQMHRLYSGELQPESAVSDVRLSESEEAFVVGDVHSSCTVTLAYEGQTLGVTMKSGVSLPGLPPQITSRFLPVSTSGNGRR
jgi:hypothetical protein